MLWPIPLELSVLDVSKINLTHTHALEQVRDFFREEKIGKCIFPPPIFLYKKGWICLDCFTGPATVANGQNFCVFLRFFDLVTRDKIFFKASECWHRTIPPVSRLVAVLNLSHAYNTLITIYLQLVSSNSKLVGTWKFLKLSTSCTVFQFYCAQPSVQWSKH